MEKGRKEITERVKDRSLSEEELKAVRRILYYHVFIQVFGM